MKTKKINVDSLTLNKNPSYCTRKKIFHLPEKSKNQDKMVNSVSLSSHDSRSKKTSEAEVRPSKPCNKTKRKNVL